MRSLLVSTTLGTTLTDNIAMSSDNNYTLCAGRAAIHRYLLPAGPTAANPPRAVAAGERDRQTDGHRISALEVFLK